MSKSTERIFKLFAAGNGSQLVTILNQLILPAAFLRAYGVALYGEWITLSAAIGYLGTLNYGLQTYTITQMTIHYNRGEVEECQHVQSAGLRILLAVCVSSWLLLLVVFALPLNSWLRLTIPQFEAQLTLYLLGGQVVTNMIAGFFGGKYQVFGALHRGTNWGTGAQLITVFAVAGLALLRVRFYWIAGAQVFLSVASILLMMLDLHHLAPDIRPTIRYWQRGSFKAVFKPSSQYALLYSSNVLAYQLPILIMQRLLGPAVVVIYSVTRTIYSMARRPVSMITASIRPEVTILYGERNWPKLHLLYDLSERLVFTVSLTIAFGCMLASSLLLHFWLHKDTIYRPEICFLLGLTTLVMGIKEHKLLFQFSSNEVREISYVTFAAYCAMIVLSIPGMEMFGLPGFIVLWGFTELTVLLVLLRLNARIFAGNAVLDRKPVYRFLLLMVFGGIAVAWPVFHIRSFSYMMQAAFSVAGILFFFGLSYWAFGFETVRGILWTKLTSRIPLLAGQRAS